MNVTHRAVRTLKVDALLFDLDGTIVDSTPIFDWAWTEWAREVGISPARVLAIHHGRRLPDTIGLCAPVGYDVETGAARMLELASSRLEGLRMIPGVDCVLGSLAPDRWAIVTSSYPDLTRNWLTHLGLPQPRVLVTALDVTKGKPAPDPFLLAAQRLDVDAAKCVAFEDSPAGLASGDAAGCAVVAIMTFLKAEDLPGRMRVRDFRSVRVTSKAGGSLCVEIAEN